MKSEREVRTGVDQLEAARLALAESAAHGVRVVTSFSDSDWIRRPANGGWSPAECFDHLNLSCAAMLPLIRDGIEEARAKQWIARGRLRAGFFATLMCWFLEPPYRIKTSTQPSFVPKELVAREDIVARWNEGHRELDTVIRGAAGFALDRPIIISPFDPKGKVRYSVYAALLILAAHERRHVWQATRLG